MAKANYISLNTFTNFIVTGGFMEDTMSSTFLLTNGDNEDKIHIGGSD